MTYVLCLYVQEDPSDVRAGRARIHRFHVYRVATPESTDAGFMLRVLDEYGEEVLCPAHWFIPVELSAAAEQVFLHTTAELESERAQQLNEWSDP